MLSEGNIIAVYSETQGSEDNTDNSARAIAWISWGTITYENKWMAKQQRSNKDNLAWQVKKHQSDSDS